MFSSSVCLCEEDTKRTLHQFALHIWQGRSLLALAFRLFFPYLRLSSFEFFIVFYDKPLSNRPCGSFNLSTSETCLRRRVQILHSPYLLDLKSFWFRKALTSYLLVLTSSNSTGSWLVTRHTWWVWNNSTTYTRVISVLAKKKMV